MLGYGKIGLRLARDASPDTPYSDWIDTYTGDAYQAACREVGALIDCAVARRLGEAPETLPRWSELADRFATATRLEVSFGGLGRT